MLTNAGAIAFGIGIMYGPVRIIFSNWFRFIVNICCFFTGAINNTDLFTMGIWPQGLVQQRLAAATVNGTIFPQDIHLKRLLFIAMKNTMATLFIKMEFDS
jgi:hypothetical protein